MGAGLPADIRRAQSGPVACSGARRQNKALDEVSAAILGGEAAENDPHNWKNKVKRAIANVALFFPC